MNNSSCSIEKHSLGLLEKDSTAVRFNQVNFTVQKGTQGELKKTRDSFLDEQNALLQLIENYSKEHDITYDYIFYTRPDLHYTTPFNILAMERAIKGNKSTIFSPGCCKFAGWCDRLGASSYQDFSTMILSTKDWMRSGGDKYTYERAFQNRAEYVNLTRFDLTPKKDYGFHTLRFKYVSQSCNGVTKWEGAHWTDMLCNDMITPDLETTLMSNEAIKIEHTNWILSIKAYLLGHTKGWNALSNAARDVAMWKMRDLMSVSRQDSDAHTRSLPDGNIVIEMADGTTSSSWIPNQGEMATPSVTTALAYAHYATENEKGFVQKSAFVDGRLVEDSCHRMDRKGNISLQTLDGTSIRHAVYHTAKEEGSPVAWGDIDVDQYSKKLAIMDKDSIILQKPIKGLKDGNGNTVSDEKQLRDQRIRYAEACNYEEVGSLKKEDLSEFKSLATFAFNVQVIEATTRQPAAVIAVGAQAKKTFREKGEKPFVTSLIRYYMDGYTIQNP